MNLRTKVFLFLALGIFTCASGIALAKAPSTATASTQSSDNISVINILDNKATMTLPEEFKRMSAKQLATQYAAANPPPKEAWYIDTGKNVIALTFSFPYPGKALQDEQVPMVAEMMKTQMAQLNPVLTTKKVNGHTVSRLELAMPDGTRKGASNHMIIQISSFNNELMMSTFTVPAESKDKYLPTGLIALDSLKY
ncbi:hypothetical protein NNU90_002166 [Citrobacter farmeri]|nr:hypothetical protein [Citrobacter farmeri]